MEVFTPSSDVQTISCRSRSNSVAINVCADDYHKQHRDAVQWSQEDIRLHARAMQYLESLSWMGRMDWKSLAKFLPADSAISQQPRATSFQMTAAPGPLSTDVASHGIGVTVPWNVIYSMVNDLDASPGATVGVLHRWLRSLPKPIVTKFFADLPGPAFRVLREKVLQAAIDDIDVPTTRLMVELEADLRTPLMLTAIDRKVVLLTPLESVLASKIRGSDSYSLATIILRCISCGASSRDLNAILLKTHESNVFQKCWKTFRDSHRYNLMSIVINAGATFTVECFGSIRNDPQIMSKLANRRVGGAQAWLLDGLLTHCINNFRVCPFRQYSDLIPESYNNRTKWAIDYFLLEKSDEIEWTDPGAIIALSEAFIAALQGPGSQSLCRIFEAGVRLGVKLDLSVFCAAKVAEILRHCTEGHWDSASAVARTREDPPTNEPTNCPERTASQILVDVSRGESKNILQDLPHIQHDDELLHKIVDKSAELGFDEIALPVCSSGVDSGGRFLVTLLHHGRLAATSVIICSDPSWNIAIARRANDRDYSQLENLLLSFSTGGYYLQVVLRALSYHAAHVKDYRLLHWLCDTGIDLDGLACERVRYPKYRDFQWRVTKIPARWDHHCRLDIASGGKFNADIPSLLAIAAERSDVALVEFLVARGAEKLDSMALAMAVRSNVSFTIVQKLLDFAGTTGLTSRKSYGSSTFREAAGCRNHALVNLIAGRVDTDGLSTVLPDVDRRQRLRLSEDLSPLGQATLSSDSDTARILSEQGANPNDLAASRGIQKANNGGSPLPHYSPLLIAIDTRNLAMVQLLAQYGAEVDCCPRWGVLRTPLQRAAELEESGFVEYLLDQGAPVNQVPCYNGATALQLAGIVGHIDIATLLLNRGADPNQAAAEGNGRTAFEGAAEWGRFDMVSFLIKAGVDLDLRTSDDGKTQVQRAVQFAKRSGHVALSEIIQELYEEHMKGVFQDLDQELGSEKTEVPRDIFR